MVTDSYEKTKHSLAFSRKQVEKAGRAIRKNSGDIEQAISVIQNYRAAHLYPLQIIKNLVWKHVRKLNLLETATIVRRLKRLPTIIDKLQRKTLDGTSDNAISLKRMHDIGGCRVILDSLSDLKALNASLDASRSAHSVKVYNYIDSPKATGYRGIHRVYKSYANGDYEHNWKGFLIEVQLRTRLQHLWATSVEIVDLIEKETLKTNPYAANNRWKRLFVIMGEFLAVSDGSYSLTEPKTAEYKAELTQLNHELSAYSKLDVFNRAFQMDDIKSKSKKFDFTLLVHDNESQTGRAYLYSSTQRESALIHYAELEKKEQFNALLVAGSDLKSIEKAYPNYLNDTSEFLSEFSRILLS